ncbi:MAG TPA: hypothetical protein VFH75_02910 [Actinomycetota bacterium]|nr:hypothetical protein [Actinomycetota bacterium]
MPIATLSAPAQAAPDHTITLSSGSQTWNGAAAQGTNLNYTPASGEPCPATPANSDEQCEQSLLHVVAGSAVDVDVSLANDPSQDFDLFVYNSDSAANRFGLVDQSGNPGTVLEVVTIPSAPNDSWYLIQVVYFASPGVMGYTATAEITGFGGGGGAGTRYYLHAGGSIGLPTFNTTPPTSPVPKVAPSSPAVGALWSGSIPAQQLDTFRVDFWQSAPIGQVLLSEVHYEIRLNVGGVNMDFPAFTAPSPFEAGPSLVTHIFTPDNSGGLLPMQLDGGSVSFVIFGQFIDAEATVQIYYDSVDFPSGFVLNVPPPPPVKAPFPPDVDNPPGLQEIVASNISAGWTSRSEMHIAQNPVNPDMLVADSKFYNLPDTADGDTTIDPLAEYEFKVGTYVSFDGAQSWTDLGQLKTCSLAESNQPAWGTPASTCYPRDLPNVEGPEEGGSDIGEEYITSDPWVQWDDEGNAYAMVLDHPPFDGVGEGNGWGMTFHRWESVSQADVASGNTWSNRIPINFYDNAVTQALLLDDKNTFAVNNAGPDNDGQTGIILACWGQVASDPVIGAGKQQEVCERSTDGGQTWPGTPVPVSGVEPLVIGIDAVADTQDPETFYVTWLQYATGGAGGDIGGENTPETLEVAITTDGGQTFTPPIPVDTITQIPRQFPGQGFRNLSIPIMAVGPNSELYIAIAQYLQAPDSANDEDGRQADITVYKSTNGGLTWSETNITDNTGPGTNLNADQFQPYIAVTESGQVNVTYFDRRLDMKTTNPIHPGNYFTDVYLSRSNDGGNTWTDVRLTHDATDPEFNAPISPSGLFFGDYQGLVVDDCFAIPFVNDTHLANDEFLDPGPERDPEFDEPDSAFTSEYQQAINWRVPNTTAFGGTRQQPCGADLSVTKTDNRTTAAPTGRNLTYTVTVTNNGPDPAEGVVLTDTLPGTVTFVSATPSVGSCSGTSTVTCLLGTMANGATATIDIVVKPTQTGQIVNTAVVTSTTTDPDTSNNTAVETTSVCRITSRQTSIPCNP